MMAGRDTTILSLWPHQQAALAAIRSSIGAGQRAGLIALPTGSGKTVVFSTLARGLDRPTLVLVHRDELVRQTIATMSTVWPDASIGVVKGNRDEWADGQQVVVASVQSLHARRLERMPRDRFDLIVADECHHAVARTWQAIVGHFNRHYLLGVSATPSRADGQGLSELFGPRPLYAYALRQAIEDGILCRLVQYAIETGASVDTVATRHGDFATGALSRAVNTSARNRVVVEAFQEYASERRAIAFTVDVQHAHDLADTFNAAGIASAVVSGAMPIDERRKTLARFRDGDIRVVANCAVLTEGFDDPAVDNVLMCRPTKSKTLYTQAVGRGLRRHDGKADCLVVDFTDSSERHRLVTALDLFGDVTIRNAAGRDVVGVADDDLAKQAERREIQSLMPLAWRLKRVCPWPSVPDLRGYTATAEWHTQPASEKQQAFIERMGLGVSRALTKGEASYLIDRLLERRAAIPDRPSSKQEWYLRHRGAWRDGMTFQDASRRIGQLKARERTAAA